MISVVNRCSIPIQYRLCYFETQHCVEARTLAYKRTDLTLGINPGMKNFRYEIYEKF